MDTDERGLSEEPRLSPSESVFGCLHLWSNFPCLDNLASILFLPPVQLMPTIKTMCAKRGQGHTSRWVASRATGIVRKIF